MRQLAVLAAVLALAAAVPRERRQTGVHGSPADYDTCRGGAGVCVPYYICKDDTVITDGAGIIDIRTTECGNFLDICCSNPDYDVTPTTPGPYVSSCGRRNYKGIDVRIQGFEGNETQPGEFPWMTAVLKKETVSGEEINLYLCGGSLIHSNIVLTAAHCVSEHSPGSLRIRLGEWDTQNEYEAYKHQDRDVHSVIIHRDFNPTNLHNDFALLYLQIPADFSENVDVICLDNHPQNFPKPHDRCIVTGWGKDRFGKEGLFQNVLKQIELPIVNHGQCQGALRDTRLGKFFKLDKSFMCAGGEAGKDACSGDGGSPLVCLDHSGQRYVQAGIVAWGIGCGTPGIPAVYADVQYAYDWIVAEADKILLNGGYGPVNNAWA